MTARAGKRTVNSKNAQREGVLLEDALAGTGKTENDVTDGNPAAGRGAWPVERFEAPNQCAGYWVRDPRGRKIGKLKRLFLNGSGGAEYAEVKVGLSG